MKDRIPSPSGEDTDGQKFPSPSGGGQGGQKFPSPSGGGQGGGSHSLAVQMQRVTKQFPGVLANDRVDLQVRKREIHALVGENGAGKSTLMNILYGIIKPDSGEILIDGKLAAFCGPRDAI